MCIQGALSKFFRVPCCYEGANRGMIEKKSAVPMKDGNRSAGKTAVLGGKTA